MRVYRKRKMKSRIIQETLLFINSIFTYFLPGEPISTFANSCFSYFLCVVSEFAVIHSCFSYILNFQTAFSRMRYKPNTAKPYTILRSIMQQPTIIAKHEKISNAHGSQESSLHRGSCFSYSTNFKGLKKQSKFRREKHHFLWLKVEF